jgi:hypothetical protein
MQVKLTINIESGNHSFQDGKEVYQLEKILRNIMWSLAEGSGTGSLCAEANGPKPPVVAQLAGGDTWCVTRTAQRLSF